MKIIKNKDLHVEIDEQSLSVKVTELKSKQVWQMTDEGPGDIGVKGHCGPYQTFMFRDAMNRKWNEINENTLECTLTGWGYTSNVWSPLSFGLTVKFTLCGNGLNVKISPFKQDQLEASIIDSYYPRGFVFPRKSKGDLVLPISQGTLLDKDEAYELDYVTPAYVGPSFQMPWWGQLDKNGSALIALTVTPDDMGFRITNKSRCGMTCHPYWQASLGGFKYMRDITYKFFAKTDVMELANEYRRHADIQGQGITLKQKALDKPMIDKMIGGAIWNIWMMSNFSQFGLKDRVSYIRFSEAIRRYKELQKRTKLERVIAHIDGWGKDGYDFNHPDVLPPDERLGGWKGLRDFRDVVHSFGHGFTLHDNYVDFYKHTEAYKTTNDGTMNLDGLKHCSTEWLGGDQEWLCSTQGMKYLKRNLDEIAENCPVDGEYVDCWSIGHLRECYDQRHLATRTQTRFNWFAGLNEFANRNMIIGSESGNDWAVPVLDFCHTVQPDFIPHCLSGKVKAFGKTIPLYSMVWHDCVMIPAWINQRYSVAVIKDGLVIPQTKDMRLWGLLWGGIPSYRTDSQENISDETKFDFDAEAKFILSLKILSDFNRDVGYERIVKWEMLDQDGMIQRTTFGNGSSAEVDFNTGRYIVKTGKKTVKGSFELQKQS